MPKNITSDNTVTLPDGTTIETITYDDGSSSVTTVPGPGSPAANQATVQQGAQNALAANRTYLAIGSPTNAQVVAQLRSVTQQMQGLIRLALGQFDGTN
jgi:hypothetical protein